MALREINLNLLHSLGVLLEEANVTRAAARLGVTQSAMSHTLRQLRAHFDDRLLVRGPRGMLLTPRAEELRGPLRRGLGELERVVRGDVSWDPATASRTFRLVLGDYVSVRLLPRLIERLRREAPRVDVDVRPTERRGDEARLESGEVDVLVALRASGAPGLRQRALMSDGFACVARSGHPEIACADDLTLDRYCALDHVLISPGGEDGSFVDTKLRAVGRQRRVALRVPHFLVAPMVVARSDLLLTAPANLAAEIAAHYPLQLLPAPLELASFTLQLVWHERFDDDPAHRWLRDSLVISAEGASAGAE